MAKLRINGDSSGYVDLEAPNAASSSTLDLDQVPQKNATTTGFTGNMGIGTNSPLSSPAGAFAWANPIATIEGSRPTLYLNGSGSLATIRMWPSGTDGSSTTLDDFHINAIATSGSTPGSLTFAAQGGAIGAGLSINSNNIVTTPDQPSFLAIAASGGTLSAGVHTFAGASAYNAHIFTNIAHNIGSHYNSSNSRFTAPVTGLYQFYGSMATDSGQSAAAYLSFEFYINGTRHRDGWDNHTVGYQKTSTVKTAYLNAGDYVYPGYEAAQIFTLLGGSLTAQYVHFGGHLIG